MLVQQQGGRTLKQTWVSKGNVSHIPFGQRPDGRIVEVSQVERGLACNCSCPACGEPLQAKKGAVIAPHFSHLPGSNCSTGAETALHLAAKQLVADRRWIRLPELPVRVTKPDRQCGLFVAERDFSDPEAWHFDRVALEMALGKRQPDAVGFASDIAHGIEIRVTHEVDAAKHADLAEMRLPSIEVDLAPLVGQIFSFDALEQAVIESTANKRWLFHPREAEWEALLLSGFDHWRRARLEELARHRQPLPPTPPPPSRADAYRAANAKYRALPDKDKWRRLEQQLGLQRHEFPGHLRVDLREGGDILLADKDLWQGAVFAQFILGSPSEDRRGQRVPREGALGIWLAQRFGARGGDQAARPTARAYLAYLKACGFLKWEAGELCIAHDELLPPPKARPTPPAPVTKTAEVPPSSSPPIRWLKTWPDEERLRRWAAEACDGGDGFDAEWFVGWLLHRAAPPSIEEVSLALEEAEGNPQEAMTVLRSLGVVADTRRYFSYGEAAPWLAR